MPTTTYPTSPGFAAFAFQDRSDVAGADVMDLSGTDLRAVGALHRPGFNRGAFRPVVGSGLQVLIGGVGEPLGVAVIKGNDPGQGNYIVGQIGQHAITTPAAEVGNIRNDEVYLVAHDSAFDTSGLRMSRYAYRKGDPGGALPGPDAAWKAYLLVCQLNFAAGATSPTVIDKRTHTGVLGSSGVPIGGGFLWFASTAPVGCIFARGQTELIVNYPELYAIWGTSFGGDGITTFGVPDLRQRFPLGRAASGTGSTLRSTGGEIDHDHTIGSHSHTVPAHAHAIAQRTLVSSTAGGHDHGGATGGATKGEFGGHTFDGIADDPDHASEHRHGIVTFAGHSHNVVQTTQNTDSEVAKTLTQAQYNTGTKNPPYLVVEYAVVAN